METLYLTSIPGMKEKLNEGLDAKIEDCVEFNGKQLQNRYTEISRKGQKEK